MTEQKSSVTWVKASQRGANIRVTVTVTSKFSQNNGLYELVKAEQQVQNYLFDLGVPVLRNRSHSLRGSGTNISRYTDTTFSDEAAAALAANHVNSTEWSNEATPTEITGVRYVDDLPKPEKTSGFQYDPEEADGYDED